MAASRWPTALLAALAALLIQQPAAAEPEATPREPITVQVGQILQNLVRPESPDVWYAPHVERLGISGKYGLTYTRHLDAGDKGMRLRFGGPVLGKTSRVGISFELRF